MTMEEELNWNKLPSNLRYLAEPAMKYGGHQFEDKIFEFLRTMNEHERRELKGLLEPTARDEAAIDAWRGDYPITIHPEARLVYFFEHLLALGNDAGFFSVD